MPSGTQRGNFQMNKLEKLLSKISSLKPTERQYAETGLGYRGFVLKTEEENPNAPTRIDVNQGVIIVALR